MKTKFTFLFSAIIAVTVQTFAQPVITGVTATPYGTRTYGHNITGTVIPGTAGANQTWDYSTLPYDAASYNFKNVDFAGLSSAYQAAYPTGNVANELYFGGSLAATLVFQLEANDLLYLGMNTTPFSTPDTQLVFPHSYLETKAGFTYDAYGTLSTPFGTFSNVVRLREVSGGSFKYDYWQFTPVYRVVMEYKVDTVTMAVTEPAFYDMQLPTGVEDNGNKILPVTIYPNPSNGIFHIESSSMKNPALKVFNYLGELVLEEKLTNEINLSNSAKGVYFVQINDETGSYSQKIIVE
jgi:hypothetical protein